jgi:hypothetical protein
MPRLRKGLSHKPARTIKEVGFDVLPNVYINIVTDTVQFMSVIQYPIPTTSVISKMADVRLQVYSLRVLKY